MTRTRSYEGRGITIHFEPRRCIHAAECVRGLPGVFERDRRPWVDATAADADAIGRVVSTCPTGALTYERSDGGPAESAAQPPSARLEANGPIYVRGNLDIVTPDGEVRRVTRAALCRCGASRNKPFCDDTHAEIGFRTEDRGATA